jgi:hypothetical protein
MGTPWIKRFMDALEVLCGTRPPRDIVRSWLNSDCVALQDWVGIRGRPVLLSHTQNIAIIEAAMLMADQPVEGEGHELRADQSKAR